MATHYARDGLEINGTAGSVIATGVLWADPIGIVTVVNADGPHDVAIERDVDPYRATLASFERAVSTGEPPMVTGREGALASALTLAVRRAAAGGTVERVEAVATSSRYGAPSCPRPRRGRPASVPCTDPIRAPGRLEYRGHVHG